MQRSGKRILILMLALVLVLGVATVSIHTMDGAKVVQAGDETTEMEDATTKAAAQQETGDDADDGTLHLDDFSATVADAAGGYVTLSEIADGKPLVVNVWATWCPYCVQEMPDLTELAERYEGRVAFAFLDAADGSRETREDAETWLLEQGMTALPVYFDEGLELIHEIGIYSYPTTIVAASSGEVLTISAGVVDPTLLSSALDELLES